ncbi:MAG: 3-dehydroshikimate dehydratase [Paenibacillus sp.]|nr:3-dehydroshikimate dehydratase [Paenibacillus sp.]
MKISLCTISFRHQLISFSDIVNFAIKERFDGIELWGVHALSIYECERENTPEQLRRLQENHICISMISDYLDISSDWDTGAALEKCSKLIEAAKWFGVNRIRTFAGHKASKEVSLKERKQYVSRLRDLCELCKASRIYLLLETHPNTLTDCIESTVTLLHEIGHDHLRINLDFLHIWESGLDPLKGLELLEPWVDNFHLKNIAVAEQLDVFLPANVYSANGSRRGMVPLHAGQIDYVRILEVIRHFNVFASLEWFGARPLRMLPNELAWIRNQNSRMGTEEAGVVGQYLQV